MLRELRQEVCQANRDLVRHGLVTLTFGNVSGIDRSQGLIAIKPSGVSYDDLTPDDLVVVDLDGKVVQGSLRPSSDTPTARSAPATQSSSDLRPGTRTARRPPRRPTLPVHVPATCPPCSSPSTARSSGGGTPPRPCRTASSSRRSQRRRSARCSSGRTLRPFRSICSTSIASGSTARTHTTASRTDA